MAPNPEVVVSPLPKRQKQQHPRRISLHQHAFETTTPVEATIPDMEFMLSVSPVDQYASPSGRYGTVSDGYDQQRGKKRPFHFLDSEDQTIPEKREHEFISDDAFNLHHFPDQYPSVPLRAERFVNLDLPNPFLDVANLRHNKPREPATVKDGTVNSYVKFRLKNGPWSEPTLIQHAFRLQRVARIHGDYPFGSQQIPKLPAGFGSEMMLDPMDCLLWKFYHTAFCNGRTLFKGNNLWLVDFAQMADGNLCVRHAVLSLAATYVLDYTKRPVWTERANFHYKEAIYQLEQALKDRNFREPGKEDAIVAAFVIMICEDIITWEIRRPKTKTQRWVEGVQTAIEILDQSNPGFCYTQPSTIQNTSIRTSNANLIASYEILAQPVLPLNSTNLSHKFKWLLNGTSEEQRRIHGGTGVSPKLLHMYSQITSLSAKITKDPSCVITPRGAELIRKRLVNFHQWSELSQGYDSEQELLIMCRLNEKGQVSSPADVTDLTAQAWVSAAQIYLQCRFYRRPRAHSLVKAPLNVLLRCIERMPCSGDLFTSQSPFGPIFIMGLVSVTKEERRGARVWFETVVSDRGSRSSVPPVWTALQELWVWMDHHLVEDSKDFDGPIGERKAWWEQMTERLVETAGPLSLS